MSVPSPALRIGLAAALFADAALAALVGDRIYAPVGAGEVSSRVTPYVELGAIQVLDEANQCSADTEAVVTIDVWADGSNADLDAGAIAAAVDAILGTDAIALNGFTITNFGPNEVLERPAADGLSFQVVMTFRYQISPA